MGNLARVFATEARKIENSLEVFDDAGKMMAVAAQEVGELLIRVKEGLDHGQFGPWLADNFTRTPRMARKFMEFAQRTRELECVTPQLLKDHWSEILHPTKNKEPNLAKHETAASPLDRHQTITEATASVLEASPAAEAEFEPEPPEIDANGREIPPHLIEVFSEVQTIKEFAQTLSTLKGRVHQRIEANPQAYLSFSENQFNEAIGNARRVLTMCGPYIICSYCGAKRSQKCRACKGSGYLNRAQARCVPEELK